VPQNQLPPFFGQIHNTGDLIFTFLLNDINTGFAVAPASNKKDWARSQRLGIRVYWHNVTSFAIASHLFF
jgi:hypothetical protein